MTTGASLLDLIGERTSSERAPAVRAFAEAFLRRLSADGGSDGLKADALCGAIVGAFDFASARGAEPIAVRAFNPTVEEYGYELPGSVVETNTEDWPFLVDSVSAELRARGLAVQRVLHPIVGVERDAEGAIEAVMHPREASRRESVMHFELERRLTDEQLGGVEEALRRVLSDVRATVKDFPSMADRARRMVQLAGAGAARYADEEVDETVAFLEWLLHDNFIFLGYREYRIRDGAISVVPDSGLGILSGTEESTYAKPVPIESLPPGVRERALEGDLLIVSKTNRLSRVHRRLRMDYIGVRRISAEGEIVGEARMLGLFTTKAYAEPASQTPLLHRKLRQILRSEDLIEGSHDYKASVSLFDSFPKDELFAASTDDLRGAVVALLGLQGEQVRLLGRRDPDSRSASLIVALPRSRYDGELLARLQDLLRERFETAAVDSHLVLGEGDRVQVHFRVHSSEGLPDVDFRELEREVVAATRTWDDELRDALVVRHGPMQGRVLATEWGARFPRYYKASTTPALAVHDIGCFTRLETLGEPFVVGLQNESDERGDRTRVGLYKSGGKVELSAAMPMLEDLGLRVIEEVPTRLKGGDKDTWVQDFGVLGLGDKPIDLEAHGARVADCISAVWRGDTESDTLNRLVLLAGLDWRQIEILRAYRKYRQRIGSRFTESYQNDVLAENAAITRDLVALFELRFDPEHERDEAAEAELRERIVRALDAVESLDHDRILRNQLGLIEATLRTNAYRRGRGAMSFKLRSADVPAIPEPAPLVEIYVYSAEMEGIHLRGGPIARGGIRWSDRMDYRTEVYGLMRAQLTKNAQIVPEGAKGGFYLKRRPSDPTELREEVQRQYVAYVRGLLDVTDNLVDGEVVHPPDTRVLDEPRHLPRRRRRQGHGDVLGHREPGRGGVRLLARRRVRLRRLVRLRPQEARDHRARGVGVGQAPLPRARARRREGPVHASSGSATCRATCSATGCCCRTASAWSAPTTTATSSSTPIRTRTRSFAERKRLFGLAGSSWNDYDRAKISEGGGVWPRTAKWIPLSEAAQRALGIEDDSLAPNDLIRDVLRAPVDLLWNGGIGTVVKASDETDDAAQDRSSDAIRVDASELRCRVVGEGGNLGLTRRARVEFARGGGRINADFIDNSAGVDCSDHEVNLKVLLGLAERAGDLTRPDRDVLLARRHRGGRRARPLRLVPAGADHRPGDAALGSRGSTPTRT